MKLTRNLKVYVILNVISTALFYWITVENDIGVNKTENADGSVTFTSSMPLLWLAIFALTWFLLYKTDSVRRTRSNLGFVYHVATIAIVLVPLLAVLAVSPFISDSFDPFIFIPVSALSLSLLIHWFFTRKNLKGFEAKSVFK